jgi:hypothetical protein
MARPCCHLEHQHDHCYERWLQSSPWPTENDTRWTQLNSFLALHPRVDQACSRIDEYCPCEWDESFSDIGAGRGLQRDLKKHDSKKPAAHGRPQALISAGPISG